MIILRTNLVLLHLKMAKDLKTLTAQRGIWLIQKIELKSGGVTFSKISHGVVYAMSVMVGT